MPSEARFQFPRINTKNNTALGVIINYLDRYSVDVDTLQREMLYNFFYVRALSDDIGSDEGAKSYLAEEAIRSVCYHLGVIESICRAADVDLKDMLVSKLYSLNGSNGNLDNGSQTPNLGKVRMSDFVSLLEEADRGGRSEESESGRQAEKQQMNEISGVFGA